MYGRVKEPVTLGRDCRAVAVPEGVDVSLPKGTVGTLTQALGGNFTVYVRGHMFRIAGADADALGRTRPATPELPAGATHADVEKLVWEQMKTCYDPEVPVNIVDLGLIYECRVEPRGNDAREVFVKMTLTEPSCGMAQWLADDVKSRIELIPTVQAAHVELVLEPRWTPERMSAVARLETGL
jgi:probable FeS assembly SUF system protein SufT